MDTLIFNCECMSLDSNHVGNPLGNNEFWTLFNKYKSRTASTRDISLMMVDCDLYDDGKHEILETGNYWKVVEYLSE